MGKKIENNKRTGGNKRTDGKTSAKLINDPVGMNNLMGCTQEKFNNRTDGKNKCTSLGNLWSKVPNQIQDSK